MKIEERYRAVLDYFAQTMPEVQTELEYGSPFQLLAAVILSAQCTDKRVNQVTPALFGQYPTPQAMSQAREEDLLRLIGSVSYPNAKSRHLAGMSRQLCERFGGEVPADAARLQTLPGVGRKTANVVTAVLFNQPNMPVDTHVFRVSERIGLTRRSRTPLETERTLTRHIPPELIPKAHHWLLLHGRYVCTARNPRCAACGLRDLCRTYDTQSKTRPE